MGRLCHLESQNTHMIQSLGNIVLRLIIALLDD